MELRAIDITDYDYPLPGHRIAKHPLSPRDSSKLLVFQKGVIHSDIFKNLPAHLPEDSHLVFNNTRVIPARLLFRKETGAGIEIFLLNPVSHQGIISQAMEARDFTAWECMVGNKKKWKAGEIHTHINIDHAALEIKASWQDRDQNRIIIRWADESLSFAEIVKAAGQMPLPPYLNRETETKDSETYQTVYAKTDGAVAAPTAGLHFTPAVLNKLARNQTGKTEITLHVGAGTFQPVKVQNALEHHMHAEQIVFKKAELEELLLAGQKKIIPVGTTSMRSLESLYWYGVRLLKEGLFAPFHIEKLYAYQWPETELPSWEDVLHILLEKMKQQQLNEITGQTEIFIFPGYTFRVCKGIITNFHQPKSTLLLLISALIGEKWKEVYDYAAMHDYRFLSYGDSSLLIP